MQIADLLTPRSVIPQLRASSKSRLSRRLPAAPRRSPVAASGRSMTYSLNASGSAARESAGALPAAWQIAELHRFADFARLDRPTRSRRSMTSRSIWFRSAGPLDARSEHLTALALVSACCRPHDLRETEGHDNADALYALLTDRTESHAA